MNLTNSLKLILTPISGNINYPFDLKLSDRQSSLTHNTTIEENLITIESTISLPNILYIHHPGNLLLKEFFIGGIRSSKSMLEQIVLDTPLTSDKFNVSSIWYQPGIARIELFDKSFIEYHLHYSNNF